MCLTCVGPAELLAVEVKGQTVGEPQVVFHQDSPICPIHVGHLNFRPVSVPVCPVQPPAGQNQSDHHHYRCSCFCSGSTITFLLLWTQTRSSVFKTHPYAGFVTMGRGLIRSVSNRTRRWLPSSLETSTVSRMESVQKRRRATWSMAMPSGLWRSEEGRFRHRSDSESTPSARPTVTHSVSDDLDWTYFVFF